jgi:crossover junction endodeoxyribonuclease RuvC
LRVLGVDPGLTRCGLGVVEGEPGRPLRLVGTDVVRTPAGDDIGSRLLALEVELDVWLDRHRPDAVAVERVFSQHNVRTVMGTAQAGAVAIVCAARRGVPVALHTPSEVKAAVTGSGRAGKQQVTEMVTRLLRLPDPPRPADSADALALAICHLWRGTAQARLAEAQVTQQRLAGAQTTRQGPAEAQVTQQRLAGAQTTRQGPADAQVTQQRLAGADRRQYAPRAAGGTR